MPEREDELGKLLTVEEVAKLLRVPVSWVYRNAEGLKVYRVGKYLRFSWQRVLDGLERSRKPHPFNGVSGRRPEVHP